MTTTQVFSSRNYQPGTYNIPSTAIPVGVTKVTMTLNRTNWTNPASKVAFFFERSPDGGATWLFEGAFTAEGGAVTGPDGTVATQTSATFSFPDPTNANRKVRGTLTVSGVAFKTDGSIVTE